ncbi:MAG: hypothetical protein WKI04_16295 [Ferruginibacter sp.]
MWFNKLFLVQVFGLNKKLFAVFCAFILLSIYVNYKRVETTPFFIWAMYAGKMQPREQYKILTVSYNDGKVFNLPYTFQEPRSMMVYFTLNHYGKIAANNMNDPMEQVLSGVLPHYPFLRPLSGKLVSTPGDNARYLPWLKTYLQSIVGEPVNNVTVHERYLHFDPDNRVSEDSSKILYFVQ